MYWAAETATAAATAEAAASAADVRSVCNGIASIYHCVHEHSQYLLRLTRELLSIMACSFAHFHHCLSFLVPVYFSSPLLFVAILSQLCLNLLLQCNVLLHRCGICHLSRRCFAYIDRDSVECPRIVLPSPLMSGRSCEQ